MTRKKEERKKKAKKIAFKRQSTYLVLSSVESS
jgi:hypothetical protein